MAGAITAASSSATGRSRTPGARRRPILAAPSPSQSAPAEGATAPVRRARSLHARPPGSAPGSRSAPRCLLERQADLEHLRGGAAWRRPRRWSGLRPPSLNVSSVRVQDHAQGARAEVRLLPGAERSPRAPPSPVTHLLQRASSIDSGTSPEAPISPSALVEVALAAGRCPGPARTPPRPAGVVRRGRPRYWPEPEVGVDPPRREPSDDGRDGAPQAGDLLAHAPRGVEQEEHVDACASPAGTAAPAAGAARRAPINTRPGPAAASAGRSSAGSTWGQRRDVRVGRGSAARAGTAAAPGRASARTPSGRCPRWSSGGRRPGSAPRRPRPSPPGPARAGRARARWRRRPPRASGRRLPCATMAGSRGPRRTRSRRRSPCTRGALRVEGQRPGGCG